MQDTRPELIQLCVVRRSTVEREGLLNSSFTGQSCLPFAVGFCAEIKLQKTPVLKGKDFKETSS